MKRLFRYLLICLATLAGLLAMWIALSRITDEKLDPRLQALLAEPGPELSAAQNGYYALLGFGAEGQSGAHTLGQRIADSFRQAWAAGRPGPADAYAAIGAVPWMVPREAEKILCQLPKTESCLHRVANNRAQIEQLLSERGAALADYRALHTYPHFRYPFAAQLDAPFIAGSVLLHAARLHRASIALDLLHRQAGIGGLCEGTSCMPLAMNQVADSQSESAISALIQDVEFWKRLLGQPLIALVDKMVAVRALTEHAILASELLASGRLTAAQAQRLIPVFQPLTPEQKSLSAALELEAAGQARNFLGPRLWGDTATMSWTEKWIERPGLELLLQRQTSANQSWRRMEPFIALDHLSSAQLKTELPAAVEAAVSTVARRSATATAFNPVGSTLLAAGMPDYSAYLLRLRDLDGLMRLVGVQAKIAATNTQDADVPRLLQEAGPSFYDPYLETPLSWDAPTQTLSFAAQEQRVKALLPLRLR